MLHPGCGSSTLGVILQSEYGCEVVNADFSKVMKAATLWSRPSIRGVESMSVLLMRGAAGYAVEIFERTGMVSIGLMAPSCLPTTGTPVAEQVVVGIPCVKAFCAGRGRGEANVKYQAALLLGRAHARAYLYGAGSLSSLETIIFGERASGPWTSRGVLRDWSGFHNGGYSSRLSLNVMSEGKTKAACSDARPWVLVAISHVHLESLCGSRSSPCRVEVDRSAEMVQLERPCITKDVAEAPRNGSLRTSPGNATGTQESA